MSSLYITSTGTCENLKHFIPELSSWVYKVTGDNLDDVLSYCIKDAEVSWKIDADSLSGYKMAYPIEELCITHRTRTIPKTIAASYTIWGLTVEEATDMVKDFRLLEIPIITTFSELYQEQKSFELKKVVAENIEHFSELLEEFIVCHNEDIILGKRYSFNERFVRYMKGKMKIIEDSYQTIREVLEAEIVI